MAFSEVEILKLQPFKGKIGKIDSVESLKGAHAISEKSFKITALGKSYKLRCFNDEAAAKDIKNNILLLSHYFPKLVGQEGTFLLVDWIEGDILRNPTIDDCYFIGKMMGEAHELNAIKKDANLGSFLTSRLDRLKIAFSKELLDKIIIKYDQMREKLSFEVVLEFNDVHQSNFIKDKQGRIYYVDEEGFDYKIKGLGLAKPLSKLGWIKTQAEKDAFWKGYNEHHSSDYFNTDYQNFIFFIQLLRTIATRVKTGADYSKEYAAVLEML